MVRVGGSGISGLIDAAGFVHERIPYGAAKASNLPLPHALPITPFGRHSRTYFWMTICGLLFFAGLIRLRKNPTHYPA